MRQFHFRIIRLLLEYSNQLELSCLDKWGNSPLHLACEDGNVEVARLLVEAKADTSMKNKEEKTPIELAKPEVRLPLVAGSNTSRTCESIICLCFVSGWPSAEGIHVNLS